MKGMNLYKEKRLMSFFKIFMVVMNVILLIFLGTSYVNGTLGDFTINLDNYYGSTRQVSISDEIEFRDPRTVLFCESPDVCTNICGRIIPENIDGEGGNHNGRSYIAYTFYAMNTGELSLRLEEELLISNMVKKVSDAIRVRVYRDGVKTDYAKLAPDGSVETHYCDESFSDNQVFKTYSKVLEPGEITKYTIVVWIEGDDRQCLDDIRGGQIKFIFNLAVTS